MEHDMSHLLSFDNNWKNYFLKEKEILLNALEGQRVNEVLHIGATSVVMCKTAGTIDLLCAIPSTIELYTIKNILTHKGYQCVGSIGNFEGMYFVRRGQKKRIVATVRVVQYASTKYLSILSFMHWLHETQTHVEKYNNFREEALEQYSGNRAKYEAVKQNYIRSIIDTRCEIK